MKRTNTNTKAFKAMVQKFIVNSFDNLDSFKQTFKNCKTYNKTKYQAACYMVEGGCFDCYYNDVAQTMADWFDCTSDNIWQYFEDDSEKLWSAYIHIIAINIVNIIDNLKYFKFNLSNTLIIVVMLKFSKNVI